jgi:cytochrome bd-type quinol oxidase subunit 2
MKFVIVGLLFLIVTSLFVALYTLVKDKGQSNRTVRALTLRISLSILLIVILLISYKAGLIKPNVSPFNYTLKSDTTQHK